MSNSAQRSASRDQRWPALRVDDWTATRDTLHMWTQIVGKIRLVQTTLVNHWWNVTLYVSPRGLTTSAVPYRQGIFEIEFDFIDHQLHIRTSVGGPRDIALEPKSVADFHAETLRALHELGIDVEISATPNEVDPAIPFADDHDHASYDPDAAQLFWRQLIAADRVCRSSGRVSWARSARCTSSGGPSIWRAPGSRDEQLRRIPAVLRTAATG